MQVWLRQKHFIYDEHGQALTNVVQIAGTMIIQFPGQLVNDTEAPYLLLEIIVSQFYSLALLVMPAHNLATTIQQLSLAVNGMISLLWGRN